MIDGSHGNHQSGHHACQIGHHGSDAQLAVEARRLRPGLKVLLTSGYTAEALTKEHGMPDDLEVLPKPYRHEDLANKLRLVIKG